MNFVGKFDAELPAADLGSHSHALAHTHIESGKGHAPADAIVVPDADLLFKGDFKRSGVDLVLSNDNHELVLHDYFKGEKRAALASPDGAHLTGAIVNALAGHVEYAQADGSASVAKIIGHVTKLAGTATAMRNGVSIELHPGDNVEKGDVVESGANSTVGITFIDGTVFGLSSNARMVLNEMVYDPNGSNNSSLLSLVAGTISFVAGETAKHGDMKIDTPVATMGIRGTAVLFSVQFDVQGTPQAEIQVLVEPDGSIGSFKLYEKGTNNELYTVDRSTPHVSYHNGNFSPSSPTLSAEVQKLIIEVFNLKFSDNSNTKSIFDHFTDTLVPVSLTPSYAAGGTPPPIVVITVASAGGPSSSGPNSTNSIQHIPLAPLVVTFGSSFSELAGVTHSPAIDTVSGIVTFADVNAGDAPTVATSFTSFTYHDAHGQAIAPTHQQMTDIGLVEVALAVVQTPGNNNVGSATWTYNVVDGTLDFLAAGETLTLTYTAEVDSNYAPDNLKTFQTFTITVTGTNDAPVITTGPESVAYAGGKFTPGGNLPTVGNVPASGTLVFTDADLTDTHSVATKLADATLSGPGVATLDMAGLEALAPAPMAAFETALSAIVASDSTETGSGTINWKLADLPVFLADFIPVGEVLTLTYTVTVTDEHGATSTQNVIVTITGTDAAAVVWIATTGSGSTGDWNDPKNWETGTVPNATNDAIIITDQLIGKTPLYPVTINDLAYANSLTMNDFGTLFTNSPTLINNSTLTVGAGGISLSADSVVDNFGTIVVGGAMEVLQHSSLQNHGQITLQDGGDFGGQSTIANFASGNIEVSGGTLNVLVDVANSGKVTVDANATLTLNGATIAGGTVNNKASGTFDLTGAAVLKNGTLDNSGQINVSGSNNALDNESVTGDHLVMIDGALTIDQGSTIANNNGLIEVSGELTVNDATIDGGSILNSGNIDLTGGGVLKNGALSDSNAILVSGLGNALHNEAVTGGHVLEILPGGALTIDQGSSVFDPNSLEIDAGTLTLNNATINSGVVENDSGIVDLTGDAVIKNGWLNNFGQINVSGTGNALHNVNGSGNAALEILAGGALTIDQGTTVVYSSGGTLTVDGTGMLILNDATVTSGTVTNKASGVIDLTGTAVLNNGSLGNSGQINVSGTGNALDNETVTANNALEILTGGKLLLDLGTAFTNGGTVTVDSTATLTLDVATISGGTLSNSGTLNSTGTSAITNAGVTNSGTLESTGGTLSINSVSTLTNSGTLEANGGELDIDNDPITNTNTLQAIDSSTLKLTTLTVTNSGGTVSDASGSTIDLIGSSIINGTLSNSGTLNSTGTSAITNAGITNSGLIESTSGTLTIDPVAGPTLTNSGTLEANGGELDITTEPVDNTGTLQAIDSSTLKLTTLTVTNTGGTVSDGVGSTIDLIGSSIINGTLSNSGTLNSTGTSAITNAGVTNSGTLESTGGTLSINSVSTLTNSGTLEANGGELDITSEPVSNSGTLQAIDDSTLKLTTTTVTNTGPGTVTVGLGSTLDLVTAIIGGGTLTNNGTLDSTGTSSIDNVGITNSGTIESTGGLLTIDPAAVVTLTNSGTVEANGGELDITSQPVSNSGTLQAIDDSTLKLTTTTVTNTSAGTVTVGLGSTLDLVTAIITGGTLTNSGTLDSTGTSSIDNVGITNSGTIESTGGLLTIDPAAVVTLTNSGTVEANGGELDITSQPVSNSGTLQAIDDSTLKLTTTTVTNTSAGTVTVGLGSTLDLVTAIINGGTLTNNGTLDSTGTSSIDNVGITNSGTIESTGGLLTIDPTAVVTLTNSGTVEANGGELDITSEPVSNSGTLQAIDDSTLKLTTTTVTNTSAGTVTVGLGSTLDLVTAIIGGGTLTNNGTLDSTGTSSIDNVGITNSGTIESTGGLLTIDPAAVVTLTNSGTVEANGGELDIANDPITEYDILQAIDDSTLKLTTLSVTNAGGTVSDASGSTIDLIGSNIINGTLSNSGTLNSTGTSAITNAGVTNSGTLESTSGTLSINSASTLTNSGTLEANGGELDIANDPITNTNTLQAIDGSTLKLTTLTVTNSGGTVTVGLGSTLDLVTAIIGGGTLTNSGTLNATGTSAITNAGITNSGLIESTGGTLTIDPVAGPTLTNSGTLEANGGELDITTEPVANTGTLQAIDGSTLKLTTLTVTNTGGTVSDASGSTIDLVSAAINGGTLSNSGTLNSTGTSSIGAAVSGGGTLNVVSGTLKLSGNNTYSGVTTIDSGAILAASAANAFSAGSAVTDNGELDLGTTDQTIKALNGTNTAALVGSFSGTGTNPAVLTVGNGGSFAGVIENGSAGAATALTLTAGTETLTGDDTYTGATTINGGTLALSGSGSIAASSGVIDAGTFDISNTTAGASIVTLSGTGAVTLGGEILTLSNASTTFGGAIGGTGGLTLTAGTETLTGDNTYTGATTINGGTLALSGSGSIADSSDVIDAGTFDISNTTAGASIVTLSSAGTVTLGSKTLTLSNASTTFGGAIGGTGGLTLTAGTETLTGTNTYSGATTINGGTLALSGTGSIAASSDVIDDSAFDISLTTAGASIVTLSGAGTVTLGSETLTLSDASTTFSGAIDGTGELTLTAGTETLSGDNLYSGVTTINGGTLKLSGSGSIADSSDVVDAGTFDISATSGASIVTLSGAGTVTLGSETLTLSNASTTFSGGIGGTGGLTLTAGTETLTGDDTYTGATTINGGMLALSGSGSIADSSDVIDAGTFDISNTTAGASIVTLSSAGTVTLGSKTLTLSNASTTFGGAIGGTGGLTLTAGTETLTGDNLYSGVTTINGGELALSGTGSIADSSGVAVGDGAAGATFDISGLTNGGTSITTLSGDGDGTVNLGANTLTLSNASTTFNGVIEGALGGLTLTAGTETLTGDNTYSGATTINGGTLALSGSIAASSDVIDGGTFDISATSGASIVTLSGAGTVALGSNTLTLSNASTTFSGAIGGTGGLTLTAGTETLTGTNTYSGATTINGGTLALSGSGSIAASSDVIDDGTFDISATSGASIVTLSGDGTVKLGNATLTLTAGAGTFSGVIDLLGFTGGLTVDGTGTETLTGANTYTGATTIGSGETLALSGSGSIADSSGVIDDGTFDISATSGASIVTLSGAGTVNLGNETLTLSDASTTFGGAIGGAGGLTLTAGTETLTGDDTYTGATTINGGTLVVDGNMSGAGSATISGGGTLEIGIGATDAQAVDFSGAGTLQLDDLTSFTGAITGLASGGIIDIANTSVTTAIWNGSILKLNGQQTGFTLTGVPAGDTVAFQSDGHNGSDLVVLAQAETAGSSSSALGLEGTPIALHFTDALTAAGAAEGATLTSFVISGIPPGATLSDSHGDTLAVTGGTLVLTASELANGALNGLSITPAGDTNFVLSAVAIATDSNGFEYTVPTTETVIVTPAAPTVTWGAATAGTEGTAITLGTLADSANGLTGDSNTLQSLVVSAIPVGDTLSDGTHSFTSAAGSTSQDVSSWNLSSLKITTVNDVDFALTATATVVDGDGNTSTNTATENVTVNPEVPTVTWGAATAGTEGTAITLGTLADSANGLTGDSNTLQSLVVSAIPVGDTLSDGTHSFTSAAGSTSQDVSSWNLSSLKITTVNDVDFALTATATVVDGDGNTSTNTATENVTVNPEVPTVTWGAATAGTEGTAITLGTLADSANGLTGDSNTLQSLVVSAIPVGDTLSDGTHSFTSAAGSTSQDVSSWNLSSLKITTVNDVDFALTATATVVDGDGNTSTNTATENVTVNPEVPTVTWGAATAGTEGTAITLGTLADSANGLTGDSNTLQSLVVSAIPVGDTLSDGTHSFTSAAGSTTQDVSSWNLSSLKITTVNDVDFALTATATVVDGDGNTSTNTATENVTVNPEVPTVTWGAATAGTEGTAITLGTLADSANGLTGDSNTLQSLVVSAIPVGDTLSDGTHSFTSAAGSTTQDVSSWNLSSLKITTVNDVDFALTATATVVDGDGNTSTNTVTENVTVIPAVPTTSGDLAISLYQGSAVALTTADLNATATGSSSITFSVTGAVDGHLALSGAPTTTITSFTQAQLAAGSVLFVSDGTASPTASFTVTASDGGAATAPVTVNATVSNDFELPGDITVYAATDTISILHQTGGTLTDAGTLTVGGPSTSTITGGTFSGGGTLNIDTTGINRLFGAKNETFTVDGSTLEWTIPVSVNAGSIGSFFPGDVIDLNNAAQLVVALGTVLQNSDLTIDSSAGTAGTVTNNGTWEVLNNTTETIDVAFVNKVAATIKIDGSATLNASNLQGTGGYNIELNGGTLNLGADNVTVGALSTLNIATHLSTLSGSGTLLAVGLEIATDLTETGGGTTSTLSIEISDGANLTLDGYTLDVLSDAGGENIVVGLITLKNSAQLELKSGASIETRDSASIVGSGSGVSGGTIIVDHGGRWRDEVTASHSIGVALENSGTVEVDDSVLKLQGALPTGYTDTGATYTGTGTIEFDTTRTLDANSTIETSNVIVANGATLTDLGSYNVDIFSFNASTTVNGGTAILATVANLGTASVINGTLDITGNDIVGTAGVVGPVTSTLTIGHDGVATFGGSVAAGQTVTFGDATGTLHLGDPADFAGTITGFASGDTIDLANLTYSPFATYLWDQSAGTLTISNGVGSPDIIHLSGSYNQSDFALTHDGGTGMAVVIPAANTAPSVSTDNIALVAQNTFGGTGEHQGAAVTYADGHLYLSYNNGAATYDTNDNAEVIAFNTAPGGATQTFSYAWSKGDIFGIAADGSQIYTAGESYPGDGLTFDTGGIETKTILVRFDANDTAGNDPSPAVGYSADNFFSYLGFESFNNVTATEQGGQTFLYAVGAGQPESYDAYIIAKYDASGDLLASATDSSVSVMFSDANGEPIPGSSAANDAVYANNDVWAVGFTAWPNDNGGATNQQAVVWEYDANLNLLGRFKDTDASLTGLNAVFTTGVELGNSLYAAGYVSTSGGGQNFLIADYNADGSIAWSKSFGPAGTDTLNSSMTIDGHLFVVGSETSGGVTEGVLMEINPTNGNVVSTITYDPGSYNSFNSITTDGHNLYVAGVSGSSASSDQAFLLTYDIGGTTATTVEDTVLAMHSLSVSAPDAGSTQIEVTLFAGHGSITLENSGSMVSVVDAGTAVELFGSQAAINAALADGVVYDPTANYTGSDTLTITTNDQGHNASGVALSTTQDVGITVSAADLIADGATLTISAPSGDTVVFATGNGTLDLTQPSTFTGEIAGTTASGGVLGTGNVLDLHGFAATNTTASTGAGSFNSTTDTTTLTVTDAPDHLSETFTLAGDLSNSHWNVTDDTHGGANIVDPPGSGSQDVGPVVAHDPGPGVGPMIMNDPGPGTGPVVVNDPGPASSPPAIGSTPNQVSVDRGGSSTFVFNFANVGQDTVTDFHPATDVLQFGNALFSNAQAALNATQDDGHGNTVITLDLHDTITLSGILKAQLHASDFHFV